MKSLRRLFTAFLLFVIFSGSLLQPVQAAPVQDVDIISLMDSIDSYLREMKFVPGTTRQGSVYLYDMKSKSEFTVNDNVTYSGASVSKISVMLIFFYVAEQSNWKITQQQATLLSKMMICSDNTATNELIKIIGDGDMEKGMAVISSFSDMWFGLRLSRPFTGNGTPKIVDGPVDPQNADADPDNATKPDNIGKLMREVATCTTTDTIFNGADSPSCLKMLALMRANKILNLIEGGVPEGISIAHKQGWVEDTHGDAAYITTPGGDYILVIFLHQRKFLMHTGSFPVMAEISRRVYNAYNPKAPLKEIRSQPIPTECPIPSGLITELMK